MEIDVRDQLPGQVNAIRFANTLALYGGMASPSVEIRADGQPVGSGIVIAKDSLDALARAITVAKRIWG